MRSSMSSLSPKPADCAKSRESPTHRSHSLNFAMAVKLARSETRGPRLKTAEREAAPFAEYADRPVEFVREVLGDRLWSRQIEILDALAAGNRVTVRSAHGVGKTWVAARAVIWFLLCHPDSVVITTAPTWRQVRDLL